MDTKKTEEIMNIIKDIRDIDEQLKSSRPEIEKLQKITLKAKSKFLQEAGTYEAMESLKPYRQYKTINQMSIQDFIERLPFYRGLYIDELRKKCDVDTFNELICDYNIDVF